MSELQCNFVAGNCDMNGCSKQTNLTSIGEKQENKAIQYMSQTLARRLTAGQVALDHPMRVRFFPSQINASSSNDRTGGSGPPNVCLIHTEAILKKEQNDGEMWMG